MFEKMDSIYEINLSYNDLSGPLPFSLGIAPNLSGILFNNNKFDGVLPSSLGTHESEIS